MLLVVLWFPQTTKMTIFLVVMMTKCYLNSRYLASHVRILLQAKGLVIASLQDEVEDAVEYACRYLDIRMPYRISKSLVQAAQLS